jgi:hypothetical protein
MAVPGERRANASRIAVLAAVALLAACGGEPADPAETGVAPIPDAPPIDTTTSTSEAEAPSPEPVGGLLATVEVARLFVQIRSFGLGLENVGAAPVAVATVQLESPLFSALPPEAQPVVLTPGVFPTVVPVPYGDPICAGEPPTDDFTAVVTLADGAQLRVPAPERYPGSIGRTHARECAARAVLEQVDVRFGDVWVPGPGHSVQGEVLLEQRRPGPPVTVESVAGTVIFAFDAPGAGDPMAVVDDEATAIALPVVITAERCDPHGLIEAKRAFVFALWAALGDAPAASVELRPEGPARVALDAVLAGCQESFLPGG